MLTGIEANVLVTSPAEMFNLVAVFLVTFIVTIGALKIISKIAETLFSRPIAT